MSDDRTTRLRTRGTIVTGCCLVMAALQVVHPRRVFPADSDRAPELDSRGWVLGGTSPGGADLGVGPTGNWWIGDPEAYIEVGAPQRVVWTLPRDGEESFAPAATTGYIVDQSTLMGAPSLPYPYSGTPSDAAGFRQMGHLAVASFATRMIPVGMHLWGHDIDDTEELIHYAAQAVQICFNGNAVGQPVLMGGGFAVDEKGSRGLHYVLRVMLAAPMHFPPYDERKMADALLRVRQG